MAVPFDWSHDNSERVHARHTGCCSHRGPLNGPCPAHNRELPRPLLNRSCSMLCTQRDAEPAPPLNLLALLPSPIRKHSPEHDVDDVEDAKGDAARVAPLEQLQQLEDACWPGCWGRSGSMNLVAAKASGRSQAAQSVGAGRCPMGANAPPWSRAYITAPLRAWRTSQQGARSTHPRPANGLGIAANSSRTPAAHLPRTRPGR